MRARWLLLPVVLVAGLLFATFSAVGGVIGARPASAASCATLAGDLPPVAGLDEKQKQNAAAIIAAGKEMELPQRAWVIAVATARQESRLENVDHGDDWYFGGKPGSSPSRGLFQQMRQYYPGVDVMDPRQAAKAFYERLIGPVDWRGQPKPRWDTQTLPAAAQAVQGSAFPSAYADDEAPAERIVSDLTGSVVVSASCQPAAVVEGWAAPLPAGKIAVPTAPHHDHPAVDLPVALGTVVMAMAPGTATPMDEFGVDPATGAPTGCGHGVFVRAGDDEWLYCHLSRQTVSAGQAVTAGQQLGLSGSTGGSTGPHLHIQLRRARQAVCVQPAVDAVVAGKAPPAVLGTDPPCWY